MGWNRIPRWKKDKKSSCHNERTTTLGWSRAAHPRILSPHPSTTVAAHATTFLSIGNLLIRRQHFQMAFHTPCGIGRCRGGPMEAKGLQNTQQIC